MNIPELALEKEHKNMYHIFLFHTEEGWCAFGYSAFYLNMIHTELKATKELESEHGQYIPCIAVSELCLMELTEVHHTLVYDDWIQIDVPPTTYCYNDNYDKWCNGLHAN